MPPIEEVARRPGRSSAKGGAGVVERPREVDRAAAAAEAEAGVVGRAADAVEPTTVGTAVDGDRPGVGPGARRGSTSLPLALIEPELVQVVVEDQLAAVTGLECAGVGPVGAVDLDQPPAHVGVDRALIDQRRLVLATVVADRSRSRPQW